MNEYLRRSLVGFPAFSRSSGMRNEGLNSNARLEHVSVTK
jgi:hypothetical protein